MDIIYNTKLLAESKTKSDYEFGNETEKFVSLLVIKEKLKNKRNLLVKKLVNAILKDLLLF